MAIGDRVPFPAQIRIFLLYRDQMGRRGPTTCQWVLVTLCPQAKTFYCDVAHALSSSTGMNNAGAVPLSPPYVYIIYMHMCLLKHRVGFLAFRTDCSSHFKVKADAGGRAV